MDVTTYNFKDNTSEKETALLLHNMGLSCVALNWKMKNLNKIEEGEIDGVFCDDVNQLYIIYDDSIKQEDRQDKISKFLNKWKDSSNQQTIREELKLKDYPIYIIYIDKSEKLGKLDSIKYILDDYTKILYTEDYLYFEKIYKTVGNWAKNDLLNFLNIKPRKIKKESISATQIWIGNTPAFIFADRVENILHYSFISRRKNNSVGYQRLVDKKRVEKMALLIKSNQINAFPNSILLNCIDEINFTPKPRSECPCKVEFDLPSNFSSCKVVDGQHRLLAFSKLESRIQDSHSLPIVLFQNMPLEGEIQTFIEINDSQKGIDPNLIYSLKADMQFQVGTKENREKTAVMIAKKLSESVGLFKENVFFGNAGEERKKKITLTTIVQSIINFRIVDSNNGFLQIEEQDIETPYLKIKDFVSNLLAKDSLNINFYKSNNGIQLILKFTSLIHRNIEKGFLKISIEESINSFTISVNKNKVALQKKYGKGGFNSLSNLIFSDIKSNNISFINMEFEIKKLI
jgi:DGQHR domain-containing protein